MRTGGILSSTANIYSGGGTGEKRINFSDISTIQFKEPSASLVGFIQFSYAGSSEKRGGILNAIDDENAIPVSLQNVDIARNIVEYIEGKREEIKLNRANSSSVPSSADELKKYKDLLDDGIITQEEFDAKKKQLLGL